MKQRKAISNCLNKAKLFARGKSVSSRDIDMGIKGISIVYPELTHLIELDYTVYKCMAYALVPVYVIGLSFIYNFKHGNSSGCKQDCRNNWLYILFHISAVWNLKVKLKWCYDET